MSHNHSWCVHHEYDLILACSSTNLCLTKERNSNRFQNDMMRKCWPNLYLVIWREMCEMLKLFNVRWILRCGEDFPVFIELEWLLKTSYFSLSTLVFFYLGCRIPFIIWHFLCIMFYTVCVCVYICMCLRYFGPFMALSGVDHFSNLHNLVASPCTDNQILRHATPLLPAPSNLIYCSLVVFS